MTTDNLTDGQKDLLRLIIKCDEEGHLVEKGRVMLIRADDKYMLWGCVNELESLVDLEALCDEGLLENVQGGSDPIYRIKNAAHRAVKSNFTPQPSQTVSPVSIGAVIQNMSGGNVQAIGNAQNSDISQTVNDPELLKAAIDTLSDELLKTVKPEIDEDAYNRYFEAIQELRKQLLEKEPDSSLVKQLIGILSFFGNVEGSVSLMLRIWPLIQPLLVIVVAKLVAT